MKLCLLKMISPLILGLCVVNNAVAADADSFFLLDVENTCISTQALGLDEQHTYQSSPDILNDNQFMVFKNDRNSPSHINDIDALKSLVEDFFDREHQTLASDYNTQLMSKVTPKSLISILKSVLKDDALLDDITQRSYIHVMGFTKIVLLTGSKDKEYKVRLHLWWPNQNSEASKLVLEDKHVHKWDFGSKMFSGSFEDQLYIVNDPRLTEISNYSNFIEAVRTLETNEQEKVFNSLNVIEMAMYGQTKFQKEKFRCSINKTDIYTKSEIMEKFKLTENSFIDIISIHESYITKPNVTGKYGLEKIGLKHLSFPVIHEIKDGDSYFHHHSLSHRLISDPDDMVATFIVTAPPIESVDPYIMMRSQDGEDITKVAPILDKTTLVNQLERFISLLESKDKSTSKPPIKLH